MREQIKFWRANDRLTGHPTVVCRRDWITLGTSSWGRVAEQGGKVNRMDNSVQGLTLGRVPYRICVRNADCNRTLSEGSCYVFLQNIRRPAKLSQLRIA